jgi:hypothetical protein
MREFQSRERNSECGEALFAKIDIRARCAHTFLMKQNLCGAVRSVLLLLVLNVSAVFAAESINQLTEEDKAGGWKLLFDGKTTKGWHTFKAKTVTRGWKVEDGWLHCLGKEGGGDLISDAAFDNFDLQWEWKQVTNGNSGLKYFVDESRQSPLGHEYQMIDDARNADAKLAKGKRVTGSFYDVLKPDRTDLTEPPGQINKSRLIVKGNHVEHWLNGAKILDYSCDSEAVKMALQQSKFKNVKGFGEKIKGHILLQDHHSEVWFRNIEIKELPAE